VDLFAGAGGLSLGFEQAGVDVRAAVEIDPVHCAVHEFNFPNCTSICADATSLTGSDIRKADNRQEFDQPALLLCCSLMKHRASELQRCLRLAITALIESASGCVPLPRALFVSPGEDD
jgi:hypothetical protein